MRTKKLWALLNLDPCRQPQFHKDSMRGSGSKIHGSTRTRDKTHQFEQQEPRGASAHVLPLPLCSTESSLTSIGLAGRALPLPFAFWCCCFLSPMAGRTVVFAEPWVSLGCPFLSTVPLRNFRRPWVSSESAGGGMPMITGFFESKRASKNIISPLLIDLGDCHIHFLMASCRSASGFLKQIGCCLWSRVCISCTCSWSVRSEMPLLVLMLPLAVFRSRVSPGIRTPSG